MSFLTDAERRLIVEVAFAGVNHGLWQQSREILLALPILIPDSTLCDICRAMLLFGMNESEQSYRILQQLDVPEAVILMKTFFNIERPQGDKNEC